MLVRRMAPDAKIVSAARETANAQFLRDSGADGVIVTAESVGRMMTLSLVSPTAGNLMEDLLETGRGLELSEREITPAELGGAQRPGTVGRTGPGGHPWGPGAPVRLQEVRAFNRGDRVVVIRESSGSG